MLGRRLGKYEQVHHDDGIKTNNDPENLKVMRTAGDHSRRHSSLETEMFQTCDGSYVVITKQIECRYCNRLFTPSSSRNKYCSAECVLKSRISRIPPIEDLKRMIWEKPMVELAKDLGVSDNIIGKWCKKYNIDKPPTGYWNKLQYNR